MSSFNYEDIEDEDYIKMADYAEGKDFIWVTPKELPPNFPLKDQKLQSCCLSFRYKEWAEKIKNFEVFEDDVWIVTYPKSGTTWCQEMMYLLKNDLDYEKASKTKLYTRFPFLEFDGIRDMPPGVSCLEKAKNSPRPRLLKTHLPIQMLPDQIWTVNPKIVYAFRNPKDVAVSCFHHYTTLHAYQGPIEEFVNAFVGEFLLWSPFHEHISSFLQLSEIKENIHLVRFEDMKKDLRHEIFRMSKFLETPINDADILKLIDHLNIDNMKKNPSVNLERDIKEILAETNRNNENNENMRFIRKGEIGGWKKDLTLEMAQKIDKWSSEKVSSDKFLQKYFYV